MTSKKILEGIELVECAQANAKSGIETVAQQCGYGDDLETFSKNLEQACEKMGVHVHQLSDFLKYQQRQPQRRGIEIAPDTPSEL